MRQANLHLIVLDQVLERKTLFYTNQELRKKKTILIVNTNVKIKLKLILISKQLEKPSDKLVKINFLSSNLSVKGSVQTYIITSEYKYETTKVKLNETNK